jgi:hypothetical protein
VEVKRGGAHLDRVRVPMMVAGEGVQVVVSSEAVAASRRRRDHDGVQEDEDTPFI